MKYKTEKEILDVIENFENCTIKRGTWGHPEHLIVAYHYSTKYDFETSYKKMKDGIFRLLESFEIDLSKEMPYHETLTVFWMKTVYDFAQEHSGESIVKNVNEMIVKFDKDYPLRFYTKEVLFSDKARSIFVKSNLD